MKLVYSTKATRTEAISLFTTIENGTHFDLPIVHGVKVSECIFEPLQNRPPMDIDGERYPCIATHCKVVPSLFIVSFLLN